MRKTLQRQSKGSGRVNGRRTGSNGKRKLRVARPSDDHLKSLRQEGLIVPDDLDDFEETVPLDFTRLSSRRLGALHSRFAVRHARALFILARYGSWHTRYRADLAMAKSLFRAKRKEEFKTKYELDDAMTKNLRIKRLQEQ